MLATYNVINKASNEVEIHNATLDAALKVIDGQNDKYELQEYKSKAAINQHRYRQKLKEKNKTNDNAVINSVITTTNKSIVVPQVHDDEYVPVVDEIKNRYISYSVGEFMLHQMDKYDITITDIALKSNLTIRHVYNLINNKYKLTNSTALALEKVLNTTAEDLIDIDGYYRKSILRK